ncbi:acylneuraminate cytidylyltransferase family protein [Fusobacterium mortiferum]|uniref:acylneuraminate cytidylyltransferase family protein n=1 Tax=Fusobacterium mortiferum TaxID=850 RepID=UPI001F45725F|nr:acylneuraminate cytidylyltransferase family protein [Fusobacterium mortiferum]MCF2700356.1 acylneuraminate cytidylyltransferase family protein [Fusobacterium mortiferum]
MEEKVLAIIPARSGSKGIKNKNIKELNEKPLISYTIEVARESEIFEDIVVSTDSEKYAEISKEYGAIVPFLREEKLSSDTASSLDVILDVLEKMEKLGKRYETLVLLQPTSPLRTVENLKEAYNLYLKNKANAVVSVCEMEHSPLWSNILPIDNKMDGFLKKIGNKNRQQLEKYYRINGAIYIANIEYFKRYKDFYYKNSYAYIMSRENSIDIDEEIDFKIAEFLMKEKGNKND